MSMSAHPVRLGPAAEGGPPPPGYAKRLLGDSPLGRFALVALLAAVPAAVAAAAATAADLDVPAGALATFSCVFPLCMGIMYTPMIATAGRHVDEFARFSSRLGAHIVCVCVLSAAASAAAMAGIYQPVADGAAMALFTHLLLVLAVGVWRLAGWDTTQHH